MKVYIWQMNDGRWHISARGNRAAAEISADGMWIYRAGLDCGFETKAEAAAALAAATRRQMTRSIPHTCNAEIGKPGAWHTCRRTATQQIHTASGLAHYCDKHAVLDPKRFKPAPFAAFRPIAI